MKKYQNYKISVTYINGDKEEINYKGINTSNYKDMIKLYSDIKDEYSDKSVNIEFIGVDNLGELKIFWSKTVEVKEEIQETTQESSIEDILQNIKDNLEQLIARDENIFSKQGILDKQQDVELHKIENFDKCDLITDKERMAEKLRIFDAIHNLRNERRQVKNDIGLLKNISNTINKRLLVTNITNLLSSQQRKCNKEHVYLTDKKAEEFSIIKRVPYKTEKERISLMSQLNEKYNKVYYEAGEILCYNKCI